MVADSGMFRTPNLAYWFTDKVSFHVVHELYKQEF